MTNYKILDQNMGKDDVSLNDYSAEVYNPQPTPNKNMYFSESPNVTQAKINLQNQLNKGTGEYQNRYAEKINSIIDKLSSNTPTDVSSQPIRQEFTSNIDRATNDTLRNLSQLSGGYGNTFGSDVANQQKQLGLLSVNDINPALVNLAHSMNQSDKSNLYNLLDAYNSQDNIAYGRHRDNVLDNQSEVQRLTDLYLSQVQNDRANFETDRNFEQGAYEFTEAQRQSAFEEHQNRLQAQTQQDNKNKLAVWGDTWDRYWDSQEINEANKQNLFKKAYDDYRISERAKDIAEAKAKAEEQARKAKEKAEKEAAKAKEEAEKNKPFVYDPNATFKDTGVNSFIKSHPLYEDAYNAKKGNQIGYLGADDFEAYLENELDNYIYEANGQEYKLTDNQKLQIIAHYDMNKDKEYNPFDTIVNSTINGLKNMFK